MSAAINPSVTIKSFLKREDLMARRRGQRKGWLRPESGSWLLTYRVYDDEGNSNRETVTIGPSDNPGRLTEKQAERFAWDHYLSKVDEIARQPKSLITIDQFWEAKYKQHCELKLKKTTREQYFSLYRKWIRPQLGDVRLAVLAVDHVESAMANALRSGKSTASAWHIRKVLSAIFSRAKKLDFVRGDNPAQMADAPEAKIVRPKIALTPDQCRAVLAALPFQIQCMVLTAVLGSMNAAELCGLTWKHVNLSGGFSQLEDEMIPAYEIAVRQHFTLGEYTSVKTGSRKRNIPMSEDLVAALSALRRRPKFNAPDDVVFASRNGTPVSRGNIHRRVLKPLAAQLGITRLGWHVFRYTHATLTKTVRMPDHERQGLMGHSSLNQTDRYTMEEREHIRSGIRRVSELIASNVSSEQIQ